jgi:hypothetical protein
VKKNSKGEGSSDGSGGIYTVRGLAISTQMWLDYFDKKEYNLLQYLVKLMVLEFRDCLWATGGCFSGASYEVCQGRRYAAQ